MQPNEPKLKLPQFDTKKINKAYKPTFSTSYTTGLFKPQQQEPFKEASKQREVSLFPGAQPVATPLSETEKRIKSLESQVANLETRLEAADAEKEPERSPLEKFFNLPTDQVWWMDLFEVIDRPLQALKYGIAEGSFNSAWEAWKGNKEFKSGSQFLLDIDIVEKEVLNDPTTKLMLDLGVDIFADPLNYITPKFIVKGLQKIGLLSSRKFITKFDDLVNGMRKAGLLKLTDDAMNGALKSAREAAEAALRNAGKNADEIAVILAKSIDQWDDVARTAYNASLEAAGVLDDAGFRSMIQEFGQNIDSNGRIIFNADNAAAARAALDDVLENIRRLNPEVTIKNVNQARRFLDDFIRSSQTQLAPRIRAFAQANNISVDDAYRVLSTGEIREGMEILLDANFDQLQTAVRKLEDARRLQTNLNTAEETIKNLPKPKPGSVMEARVAEKIRKMFQDLADKNFDNVLVVVGDARGKADDIVFWVKDKKSGNYMRLQNADGTNFKFEVKTPKKFSLLNSNLRVVDKQSILENSKKLRDKAFRNSDEGQKLYREWLEDVAVYRDAGGAPTFRLSNQGSLAELGEEAIAAYNDILKNVLADVNKGKYTMSQYFAYLDEYYNKFDELFEANPARSMEDIRKEAMEAVFGTKKNPRAGLPEGLSRTITLNSKSEVGRKASKEFLKLKSMADPTNAYGFVINDELIILNPDDFFEVAAHHSFSIESTIASTKSKGVVTGTRRQSKMSIYMSIDADALAKVSDPVRRSGWFPKALTDVAEEVAPTARIVEQYKAGKIVQLLNNITDSSIPFIAPTAKFLASAIDGFTFLFNSTKGLPDDLVELIAKIPAEDLQAAKVSVAKVKSLTDDIVKATKGKYDEALVRQTISELVEQGWDGVTIAGRRMTVRETFKRWAMQYRRAGSAQYVNFANQVDFLNLQDKIADVLRKEGMDPDFVKLVRKEGFTSVQFADGVTAKEVDEFVQNLGLIGDDVLDLGKGSLTTEQLALAKEFNQPIQEIIKETVGQQNFLRQLGFDFRGDILGTGAYFRHTINPQMLQFLKNKSPASIKKFLDAGTDMLRDRIYIGSISEINAAVKEMFGINVNLFATDAAFNFADLVRVATTKNEMQTVLQALLKAQDNLGKPIFEVIDDLEMSARGIKSQFKILNGSFKSEFPNLFKNVSPQTQEMLLKYFDDLGFAQGSKVIAVQKSAFGVLKRLDNAYIQLPEFIQNYDQFMKFWKTFALITPGYHTRNFFGNITNSFMAGMPITVQGAYMFRTSSDFLSYRRVMNALYRGEDIGRFSDRVIEAFKRVDDYYRSGASQSHRGVRDLEIIKQGRRAAKGQTKKLGEKLLWWNYQAAEVMDDMQRYSLYQWAYKKARNSERVKAGIRAGLSSNEITALRKTEAYRRVSEALFDYSHLTPFEQEYMKRLFPFYTFFKNNLIFQMKSLFERPGQYGKLFRFQKYYTESMTGFEIEDIPNYMTNNLWLPMPYRVTKNNAEAIEWLRLNLPPSDFTEFVQNPFERGVTSLTVPIKFFIEMGTGRDLFTGRQIREFPGQKDVYKSEGFLKEVRDSRGRLTLSSDPLVAKFLNDIGFRSIFNYGTSIIEMIDFAKGDITRDEMLQRVVDALGLTRVQELSDMEIASLYQNIDNLRDLKDYYEQENDGKLPTLKDIAELAQQQEQPQTGLLSIFN